MKETIFKDIYESITLVLTGIVYNVHIYNEGIFLLEYYILLEIQSFCSILCICVISWASSIFNVTVLYKSRQFAELKFGKLNRSVYILTRKIQNCLLSDGSEKNFELFSFRSLLRSVLYKVEIFCFWKLLYLHSLMNSVICDNLRKVTLS